MQVFAWSPVVIILLLIESIASPNALAWLPQSVTNTLNSIVIGVFTASTVACPIGLLGRKIAQQRMNNLAMQMMRVDGSAREEFAAKCRFDATRASITPKGSIVLAWSLCPRLIQHLSTSVMLVCSAVALLASASNPANTSGNAPTGPLATLFLIVAAFCMYWAPLNWKYTVTLTPRGSGWLVSARDGPWAFGPIRYAQTLHHPPLHIVQGVDGAYITDARGRQLVARFPTEAYGHWQLQRLRRWLEHAMNTSL